MVHIVKFKKKGYWFTDFPKLFTWISEELNRCPVSYSDLPKITVMLIDLLNS